MDGIAIVPKRPKPDIGNISKDRRDWLEIFGNQWGTRRYNAADVRMTPDEKQAIETALNPFAK